MGDADESKEWAEQMSQCILGATLRAARNTELYLLLLDCASRQPTGASSRAAPAEFMEMSQSESLTTDLTALSTRFFARLLQFACNSDEPPPELSPADPRWHRDLTNYVERSGRQALDALLARGDTASPRAARDAAVRVRNFGTAYFEFIGEAARISAMMEREHTSRMLEQLERAKHPAPMLELRCATGETAAAELLVANTRARPTRISASVPALRRADGVGPAFAPPISIEPEAFALEPSQEASVRLSLRMDSEQFAPDALYVGEVRLQRDDEPEVRIPMHVRAESQRAWR